MASVLSCVSDKGVTVGSQFSTIYKLLSSSGHSTERKPRSGALSLVSLVLSWRNKSSPG